MVSYRIVYPRSRVRFSHGSPLPFSNILDTRESADRDKLSGDRLQFKNNSICTRKVVYPVTLNACARAIRNFADLGSLELYIFGGLVQW